MKVIAEKVITDEALRQMVSERVSSFRVIPNGPLSRRGMAAVLRAAEISNCPRVFIHVSPCLLDRTLHIDFYRDGIKGTRKAGWWLKQVVWRHFAFKTQFRHHDDEAEFERRGTPIDSCRTPHAVRTKHLPRRDRRVIVEVDSNGNTIMHGCVKRWEGLMLLHKRRGGQK